MPTELWIGVLGGGFALLGVTVGAGLNYMTGRNARKASVRDQAHRTAIETCSNFIGVSFIFMSRKHDIVSSLARLQRANPKATSLGHLLDDELLKSAVHPMIEQFYTTCVRAEATAPTAASAKHIHEMAIVHAVLGELMAEGLRGKLPSDWKTKADRCVAEHDTSANKLILHLRDFDASSTYRKPISYNPKSVESDNAS